MFKETVTYKGRAVYMEFIDGKPPGVDQVEMAPRYRCDIYGGVWVHTVSGRPFLLFADGPDDTLTITYEEVVI